MASASLKLPRDSVSASLREEPWSGIRVTKIARDSVSASLREEPWVGTRVTKIALGYKFLEN